MRLEDSEHQLKCCKIKEVPLEKSGSLQKSVSVRMGEGTPRPERTDRILG